MTNTKTKGVLMGRKWLVSVLGAAAVSMSVGAQAQSAMSPVVPNIYAGIEVGQSDIANEDDIGFKIFGGYQFTRNIAAELGYGMMFDKSDVEVTALELVAVGMFPIANQFSLIGKLGLANVEVDGGGVSDDKTEITWGIGVQFDVSRNLGVRALWQRYETEESLDWLAIGAVWRF
jgi:opacity protein-like surface antigen